MSSHSELKRTSSRSGSSRSTWNACSWYVRALASISSPREHAAGSPSARSGRRRARCSRRRSGRPCGRGPGTRAASAARPCGRGGCRARSGRGRASRAAGGPRARPPRACARARPRAARRRRCGSGTRRRPSGLDAIRPNASVVARRSARCGPTVAPVPPGGSRPRPPPPHEPRRERHPTTSRRLFARPSAAGARRGSASCGCSSSLVPASVLLAIVSTVFGMMMAVASDLPELENRTEYQDARNSVLVDATASTLGVLTEQPEPRDRHRTTRSRPSCSNAIIAIEDQRFYTNSGVDIRGIGARVRPGRRPEARRPGRLDDHPAVRQERARAPRTSARCFQKLREAALAYHLTRKWSKQQDPHAST